MMDLAANADQYIKQEQRRQRDQADRPDHFGDVGQSRRKAFAED